MTPRLWKLFWPSGFVLLVAVLICHLGLSRLLPLFLLSLVYYGALAATALMAWRFSRSRVLYALLVLLLAFHFGDRWVGSPSGFGEDVLNLVAVALPLNFMVICFFRERGLFNLQSLAKTALVAIQIPLAAHLLIDLHPGPTNWLRQEWFSSWPESLASHPQSGAIALGAGLLVTSLRFWRRPGAIEASLFWSLAAFACALFFWNDSRSADLLETSAILILASGLFAAFHRPAYIDEVTSLPGELAFAELLPNLRPPLTIAIADLDHFQKFNERHGWDTGNQALRMMAAQLSVKGIGATAFRYREDQFALVFKGLDEADIHDTITQLHQKIAARPFYLRSWRRPKNKPIKPTASRRTRPSVQVTLSIGVAGSADGDTDPSIVFSRALVAVQTAKREGRNRIHADG